MWTSIDDRNIIQFVFCSDQRNYYNLIKYISTIFNYDDNYLIVFGV